jgi:hypothetical protein
MSEIATPDKGGDWLADYLEWKAEQGLWEDGADPVRPGEETTT